MIFPIYGKGYADYLKGLGPMRDNLMKMNQFSPYFMDNYIDFKELLTVILAHIIRGDRLG